MKWLKANKPIKFAVSGILFAALIVLFIHSAYLRRDGSSVEFQSLLDKTAITVDGSDRTFREVAFYIAYEESTVEEEAEIYNPDNPIKYWNLHIDGTFVRIAARNAAAQMAVHDELFYQMAMEDGIELTQEEEQSLKDAQDDFWNDLSDYGGDEKIGVSREDIDESMERMIYSQKYQEIYAIKMDADYEDYDFTGDAYQELLEKTDYSINEKLWQKLKFGSVTLTH